MSAWLDYVENKDAINTSGTEPRDDVVDQLRERFLDLWRRCLKNGAPDYGAAAWQELLNRYQEAHRRYHCLDHVRFCLKQLDLVIALLQDPDAVEMSIWYHDVIYEPRKNDNEKCSAGFFAWYTVDLFPDDFVANVRHFILATEHPDTVDAGDACYVTDIDLSSFALPWDEFQRDNDHLREEQSDVPADRYFEGKKRFLTKLANRPRIFRTDFFYALYEERARKNIERYLAELVLPPTA